MAEACHGLVDGKEYNLIIGSSFRQKQNDGFYHSVRYDFKPASVDSSKPSELTVGSKNDITVKVPNVQESESTVFKGSKRPCTKECILIIDRETGEVKLERLASNIQLKKIRSQNSAPAKTVNQPSQPVAKISSKPSVHKHRIASKGDNNSKPKEGVPEKQASASKPTGHTHVANKPSRKSSSTSSSSHGSNSDSSSSGSDSDPDQDDSETEEQAKALDEALMQEPSENKRGINLIDEDLRLSDSDSD